MKSHVFRAANADAWKRLKTLRSAAQTVADKRITELEAENARLKAAFLRYIQHDNACLNRWGEWIKQGHPCEGPPCGTSGDWNAEKCGCAEEARKLVAQCRHELETYQTPDNGVGGRCKLCGETITIYR